MLTMDALKRYGANTIEGVRKCGNKESLYLRLVEAIPYHEGFKRLEEAIKNKDMEEAFNASNSLKGAIANLSLTPLFLPIMEITENLRAQKGMNYNSLLKTIKEEREKLEMICKD